LPTNEFIEIVCEDVNGGPKNVFATNVKEYIGTMGDYLRFENNKYLENGVMAICDVEMTINVVDENLEAEITAELATCETYYQ
jgi:hypothetical protein